MIGSADVRGEGLPSIFWFPLTKSPGSSTLLRMPIEFKCPQCESLLRVDDLNAGKRARCPHCGTINRIPGELIETTPEPPVSQQFFIDSVSGQTYGPILKSELDQWVSQGRISGSCLIRGTGQTEGQPASVYYPALAEKQPLPEYQPGSQPSASAFTGSLATSTPEKKPGFDPYAAPLSPAGRTSKFQTYVTDAMAPVKIDLGQIFSLTYDLFVQNLGLLISAAVICLVPQIFINIVEYMAEDQNGQMNLFAWMIVLVLNLIQSFLVIGQTRISLRVVRGQEVDFSELFSGGDKLLPVIGYSILIFIPMVCSLLLLVVPFVFLLLYFWPSYTLIVDNKSSVFDSFGMAFRFGECNLMNSFVLGLASFGIVILGMLACGIGLVFSSGFLSVLWAAAYLMMSGQVRIQNSQ